MTDDTVAALRAHARQPGVARTPDAVARGPHATVYRGVALRELAQPADGYARIANTATWVGRPRSGGGGGGGGELRFRTSSGQDEGSAYAVPFGRPRLCQGVVAPFATYTVWTCAPPTASFFQGRRERTAYVWWARLERLAPLTEARAATLLEAAFLPRGLAASVARVHGSAPIVFPEAPEEAERGFLADAERAVARLAATLGKRKAAQLEAATPYWRAWACPLLFRLWRHKALMALSWPAFVQLARFVREGAPSPAPLMFRWCYAEFKEPLPALDLTAVLAWGVLRRPLGAPLGPHAWPWPAELSDAGTRGAVFVALHVLQRVFEKTAHTYLTPAQIGAAYFDRLYAAHLAHGVADAQAAADLRQPATFTKANLGAWLRDTPGLLDALAALQVVVRDAQPVVEQGRRAYNARTRAYEVAGERWSAAPQPVLYPAYQHALETRVVGQVDCVTEERFDRAVHADGCATHADVLAKIAAAQPPAAGADRNGVPQWHEPAFQAKWAQCDPSQRAAVVRAVLHAFSLVDGRPGYGKTHVGEVMAALFARDQGFLVPLAAYGRIAALLKTRLGDGWTFHKAAALLDSPKTDPVLRAILKTALTDLWDELSVQTQQHWELRLRGSASVRLVILGDAEQMPAIGAGALIGSLLDRYRGTDAYTRLRYPHRFLPGGAALALGPDGLTQRPASAAEGAAVVWNMQELERFHADPEYAPDLLYGTSWADVDAGARFVILPRAKAGWAATLAPLVPRFYAAQQAVARESGAAAQTRAAERLFPDNALGLQLLVHRNAFRSELNRVVSELIYPPGRRGQPSLATNFLVGEPLTFARNAYFSPAGRAQGDLEAALREQRLDARPPADRGEPAEPAEPAERARKRARLVAARPGLVVEEVRSDDAEPFSSSADDDSESERGDAATQPSATPAPARTELTDRSQNVMNGEVRRLVAVVDVAPAAEVAAAAQRGTKRARDGSAAAKPGPARRIAARTKTGGKLSPGARSRLLVFNKGYQLNVTRDYASGDIQRAYVTTTSRAQGGEYEVVLFAHEVFARESGGAVGSDHVTRELVHTAQTRAQKTFIWVGTLAEYLAAHRRTGGLRQERFAQRLAFAPPPPDDATTVA